MESKRNAKAAIEFAVRDELNRRQVPTYGNQGQQWHLQPVHSLLKRM